MVSSPPSLFEGQKEEGPDHMDTLDALFCPSALQHLLSQCWGSQVPGYFQEEPGKFCLCWETLKGWQLLGRLQSERCCVLIRG